MHQPNHEAVVLKRDAHVVSLQLYLKDLKSLDQDHTKTIEKAKSCMLQKNTTGVILQPHGRKNLGYKLGN